MKIDSRFKNVLEPEFDVVAIVCKGYDLLRAAASEMVFAVRELLRDKTYLSPTLKEKVNYLRWKRKEITTTANRFTERSRQLIAGASLT
jgi:DNA-binding NarL/FixJ family response regulator